MRRALIVWISNSLAIFIVAYYVKGMDVSSLREAFVAGALFSILTVFVRPILVVLTLPLTIITLGLFYFVITAFCLWVTDYWLSGLTISNLWLTFVCALFISLVSTVIQKVLNRAASVARA